ncbi:pilus assembly protein [Virgibacillus sp. NKC19-16]|uniref:TadE/TadG family type IV pilus assembly protein n=1 Tax=Virgibacillus salidurans TaxID=2831673 RepID=UPI001F3EF684|nr:TadE/TadG family type IV pilus assembly protein [Virgibacillus sp. NKC19-16]UJL47030.1 pilus assembly protein [Virgibacillus sp. NKC19-16]
MKKWRKRINNEEGSATIEFLGIVPLALILLMILIQFIVGINGVLVTQSAANEYANVYSITKSPSEAQQAANKILSSTGDYLQMNEITTPAAGAKEFETTVSVNLNLIFLPDSISAPSIPYSTTAYGRVIE